MSSGVAVENENGSGKGNFCNPVTLTKRREGTVISRAILFGNDFLIAEKVIPRDIREGLELEISPLSPYAAARHLIKKMSEQERQVADIETTKKIRGIPYVAYDLVMQKEFLEFAGDVIEKTPSLRIPEIREILNRKYLRLKKRVDDCSEGYTSSGLNNLHNNLTSGPLHIDNSYTLRNPTKPVGCYNRN